MNDQKPDTPKPYNIDPAAAKKRLLEILREYCFGTNPPTYTTSEPFQKTYDTRKEDLPFFRDTQENLYQIPPYSPLPQLPLPQKQAKQPARPDETKTDGEDHDLPR